MERSPLSAARKRDSLRIAVLSAKDPLDRRATSGTPFYMCRALSALGHEMIPLGPIRPVAEQWRRVRNKVTALATGKRWPYEHSAALAHAYVRQFTQRLREVGAVDAIFAPFASTELSALDVQVPVIYTGDATMPLLQEYHPGFSRFTTSYATEARAVERRALARASVLSYPSHWASASAIEDCGASAARICIAPFGPNLDHVPSASDVQRAKSRASLSVLFVGTTWNEKGGPIAVRAVEMLRAEGVAASLTVCGVTPPDRDRRPWMTVIPRLDKNLPQRQAQLVSLMLDARVVLVPTRNDCYGVVFAEAAACGTPSIATDTGGVSAAVIEGVTGHLLPPDAPAEAYANLIAPLFDDATRYASLSASARVHHETVQNWEQWATTISARISAACRPVDNR